MHGLAKKPRAFRVCLQVVRSPPHQPGRLRWLEKLSLNKLTDDEELGFIRVNYAAPGDEAPRLAYADWLDEHPSDDGQAPRPNVPLCTSGSRNSRGRRG